MCLQCKCASTITLIRLLALERPVSSQRHWHPECPGRPCPHAVPFLPRVARSLRRFMAGLQSQVRRIGAVSRRLPDPSALTTPPSSVGALLKARRVPPQGGFSNRIENEIARPGSARSSAPAQLHTSPALDPFPAHVFLARLHPHKNKNVCKYRGLTQYAEGNDRHKPGIIGQAREPGPAPSDSFRSSRRHHAVSRRSGDSIGHRRRAPCRGMLEGGGTRSSSVDEPEKWT